MDFQALIHECAPTVAPSVIRAIIRTESNFDPLALNINGPVRLTERAKSVAEAASWAQWLISQGYSVDVGLMQINSRNLAWLELTLIDAFDPCTNIRAGASILAAQYDLARKTHGEGEAALLRAISAYNTGNFHRGFSNGYVDKVLMNGHAATAYACVKSC